jgi:prepilin-type processing-associated H-X9-DG protein
MTGYAANNNGQYPRVYYERNDGAGLVLDNNGYDATNPFTPAGIGTGNGSTATTGHNNVPACIFLLLRTSQLTPDALICPSAQAANAASPDQYGDKDSPTQRANFTSLAGLGGENNLSYSMQIPYPTSEGLRRGFTWDNSIDPGAVLAADMNPGVTDGTPTELNNLVGGGPSGASGTDELQKFNSRNHRTLRNRKEGQNVLYADGHVEFSITPYCGQFRTDLAAPGYKIRDGIYWKNSVSAPGTESPKYYEATNARPDTPLDTVLMPYFGAPDQ